MRSTVAVIVAVALSWQSTILSAQIRQPPPFRSLESIFADIRDAAQPGRPDNLGIDDAPTDRAPRTTPLWSAAYTTARKMSVALDLLLRTRTGPFRTLTTDAMRFLGDAVTDMVQVETDFQGALDNMKLAADRLHQAQLLVPADPDALQFTVVGQAFLSIFGAWLASDGIGRARTGGVDAPRIANAEAALAQGISQIQSGQYVLAFDGFGPGIIVGNLPFFSLDLYEQNIRNTFETETVGFQYAIARNGQLVRSGSGGLGANGLARTSANSPQTNQSPTKEMNIASTSKTITATVLIQLLEDHGVSVDSSISPWLPPDWARGPGIDQLTFRDLMTHHSGLDHNLNGDYDLASLQSYIATGIVAADKATYKYQNANFALFRAAIPFLRYGAVGMSIFAALAPLVGASYEQMIAGLYIGTVYDYAFNPTGVIQAQCKPNDATQTLLYHYPDGGASGFQNGDWTLKCGSGGWFMSTVELVGFMAFRRFSNLIMTSTARATMDNGFLGWMSPDNYDWPTGEHGIYRSHGGDLHYDDPPPERGLDACIIEFPNGIQTALLINSIDGNYSYQCAELASAFDHAWITP